VLQRFGPQRMAERVSQLRAQHAEATDSGLRNDLERSLASLSEQQTQIAALLEGRGRLLARLERELASLERSELSLAMRASGDASVFGLRRERVGDELTRQAEELHDEGLALQSAMADIPARGQ